MKPITCECGQLATRTTSDIGKQVCDDHPKCGGGAVKMPPWLIFGRTIPPSPPKPEQKIRNGG